MALESREDRALVKRRSDTKGSATWRRFRPVVLVWGVWTGVALLVAAQFQWHTIVRGGQVGMATVVGFELAYWYGWALATRVILGAGRRYPLDQGRWIRHGAAHLLISAAVGVAMTCHFAAMLKLFASPEQANATSPYLELVIRYGGLKYHYDVLLYWAILGAGLAVDNARKLRERSQVAAQLDLEASQLEAELAKARLNALRLQLQPHFLFNTLHAISSMMDEDVQAAKRMISRVGDLLRMTLDIGDRDVVTLQEELTMLDKYIEIESIRFGSRLTVTQRIDPAALGASVPILLLQPLVENSIRHGIECRVAGGRVEVQAGVSGERLVLEVIDNGTGLEDSKRPVRHGIGLRNIEERLRRHYGDGAAMSLLPAGEEGLRVSIELPYSRAEGAGLG